MSRAIQGLVVLVLVIGLLQWFAPRWAGGLLARELAHYDHGPKPSVAVSAVPFWEMASGRFQDIYVNAREAELGSLVIQQLTLNWQNGGVALGPLEKGHLVVKEPGRLTLRIVLRDSALSAFLAKKGTLSNPRVVISPTGVQLKGRILLGQSYVPLDTSGPLVESSDHRQLIFHPTNIDGLQLPVLTDIQLLNLSTMKLPMALTIQKVQLEQHQLAVTVGN